MKISRLAFSALAMAGILALLWLVVGNAYARHREKQVERAWVQSFGTLQQLLDRYPKTTTNDTARRLEELVKPLGLDLTPKTHDAMSADAIASSKSTGTDEKARRAASDYLTSQLEKPEASLDSPPPEVTSFFAVHANALLAIENALLTSPEPRWNFDPASLPGRETVPNVYGLIRLQRALLAKALAESVRENAAAAGWTLEASWRLNQTLRDVPDVMCQVIALAVARLQIGALRKVNVDASVWRPRLAEHDFKRSVFDTELLVLWPSAARHRQLEQIESRSKRTLQERLEAIFAKPYGDIVWSEVIEKMRLAYLRIKDSPLLGEEVWKERDGAKRSAAEILFSIQMPNLLDCFRRVDLLIVDAELTEKVLQARRLRVESGLKWPTAVPGIEATRLPGARWIYSVSPQGTMSLSLSKEPNWNPSGLVLPCRFTSS